MDKDIKKYMLISTYVVVLYLALSNIKIVLNAFSNIMGILSPLIIGICIAFILNILLNFIEKRCIKKLSARVKWIYNNQRLISIFITYIFTIVIISMIILFVFPQVIDSSKTLANKLPRYMDLLKDYSDSLHINLGLSKEIWEDSFISWDKIVMSVGEFTANTVNILFDFTKTFTFGVLNFLIGIVFSIYFLIYKEKLARIAMNLSRAFLGENISQGLIHIAKEINDTFSRFIGGQVTEAFILGSLCFIGMIILKIPYAPLISVLVGLGNLIPILGAYLGTIPGSLIIFMEEPMKALVFIIFIIILQQIENNLIYPKVVGNAIGLDGLWVFLAITIGGSIFGVMGMLIGVPTMAIIYSLVREVTYKRLRSKK